MFNELYTTLQNFLSTPPPPPPEPEPSHPPIILSIAIAGFMAAGAMLLYAERRAERLAEKGPDETRSRSQKKH